MFKLRYYQEEAVAAVEREWAAGNKKTLIVLSTGCHAIGEKVLLANGRAERVENINVGDKIVTSGLGGIYPKGLFVGKVMEIRPDVHGISQYAVISPEINIDDLKAVCVVKNDMDI